MKFGEGMSTNSRDVIWLQSRGHIGIFIAVYSHRLITAEISLAAMCSRNNAQVRNVWYECHAPNIDFTRL